MRKLLIGFLLIVTGLYCLLAWVDRRGWAQQAWQRVLPTAVQPRRPSVSELQMAELSARMEQLRLEIDGVRKAQDELAAERKRLLAQLREKIARSASPAVAPDQLLRDDPVAAALLQSIDAEDQKAAGIENQLRERKFILDHLEARLIALNNGIDLLDQSDLPWESEEASSQGAGITTQDRYRRILREALHTVD